MGSACLFFALAPKAALLTDLNQELVATFLQVRDHPFAVADHLVRCALTKSEYLRLRAMRPDKLTAAAVAARFIYLNRYCFNGLYRTNLKGEFNVPYAPNGTGQLPTRRLLRKCAVLLKNAKIQACDFDNTIDRVRKGDFVYLDPPFVVERRRVFREYSSKIFTHEDLARLKRALKRIDAAGATFVVSYADSREGRDALSRWEVARVRTRRNIAGFHEHRGFAYELLATNASVADFCAEV